MNKIFFLFSFLFCSITNAQDTIATVNPKKETSIQYTEAAIYTDTTAIGTKTFEENFKTKYTKSEFVYEYKTPKKNAWDRFKEWLAAIFKNLFNFSNNETSTNFVSILLKVLAVLIIVVVIYLITKALINKEGQWLFGKDTNRKTIFYSDIEKNIHSLDFKKLIEESLRKDEKRLCIRYYYLWLLKGMAQNHYIEWDTEKTNSDYLYEIQNPTHKKEFTYLSYLYNYIWYGEFEIDETMFQKAQISFTNAIKKFGNE